MVHTFLGEQNIDNAHIYSYAVVRVI